ncbi:MAG: hypothetical protein ABIN05_07970 [candidate division WOR-3 bacterium]
MIQTDEVVTFEWIFKATRKEIKEKEEAVKLYLKTKEEMIERLLKKNKPIRNNLIFYKLAYLKAKKGGIEWTPKKF